MTAEQKQKQPFSDPEFQREFTRLMREAQQRDPNFPDFAALLFDEKDSAPQDGDSEVADAIVQHAREHIAPPTPADPWWKRDEAVPTVRLCDLYLSDSEPDEDPATQPCATQKKSCQKGDS